MTRVWIKVTKDDLRLPIAIADSAAELARMTGTTSDNIHKCVYSARRRGGNSAFEVVEIDDDE